MMKLVTNQYRFAKVAAFKANRQLSVVEDSPKVRRESERRNLSKHVSSSALLRSVNSSSPVLKQNNLIAANYEISSAVGATRKADFNPKEDGQLSSNQSETLPQIDRVSSRDLGKIETNLKKLLAGRAIE